MRRHLWKVVPALGPVLVMFFAVPGLAGSRGIVWPFVSGGTLLALVLGPRMHRASQRGPWRLLLAGMILTTATGIVEGTGGRGMPQLVLVLLDAGYLTGQLVITAATLWFARLQRPGGDHDSVIDGVIIGLGLLTALWGPFAGSLAANGASAAALGLVLVPAIYVGLVATSASLLFVGGFRLASAWLISGWCVAGFGASLSNALLPPEMGSVSEAPAMAGFLFLAAAALHPSAARLTLPAAERRTGVHFARIAVLGCALIAGPLGLLADAGLLSQLPLPVIGTVLVTLLLLWRMTRLVTERERASHAQLVVAELGRHALEGCELPELFHEASLAVARVLRADLSAVFALEGGTSVLAAGSGWRDHALGAPVEVAVSPLAQVLSGATATAAGPESSETTLLAVHGVVSTAAAVIHGRGRLYGALSVHSRQQRTFSASDLDVLRSVANVLAGASSRRAAEDEIRHRAFHDPLTGLANRDLFMERAGHALETHRRTSDLLAVLFVDLDDFKTVNDSLGHAAGDTLLVTVAERLRRAMRPGDTAARLGGDEFAILLEHLEDESAATAVAERIQAALADPLAVGDRHVRVSASIGITWTDRPDVTAGQLLRDADTAMYTAKASGKGTHELFVPAMHEQVLRRLELKGDLDRALRDGEFFLEYQPIVEIISGEVSGAEALLRWRHPTQGLIPPLDFIPLAEDSGLIIPLGRWVLNEACLQARQWQREHPARAGMSISVNLSARQLSHPGIVDDVAAAIATADLDPAHLTLELTESTLLSPAGAKVVRELQALGLRLAIDDFGTGYSSLGQLRNLRPDVLKIDKSFIDELGSSGDGASLAHGILRLASNLDVVTVAEGVEGEAQRSELIALDCKLGQGFYFARPLSADSFADLLGGRIAPVV